MQRLIMRVCAPPNCHGWLRLHVQTWCPGKIPDRPDTNLPRLAEAPFGIHTDNATTIIRSSNANRFGFIPFHPRNGMKPVRCATCFTPDAWPPMNVRHRLATSQHHTAIGLVSNVANLAIAPIIQGQTRSSLVSHRHPDFPPLPSKRRGNAPGDLIFRCPRTTHHTKYVYVHPEDYSLCVSLTTPLSANEPPNAPYLALGVNILNGTCGSKGQARVALVRPSPL